MRNFWKTGLSLALAATLLACGPSEEGETRAWDQNKLAMQEYSGKFPNFRPAFDERMSEAQQLWEAAKALSDKEARAQKMREANDKLSTLTYAFQEVERKLRDLDTLKQDRVLLALPGYQLMPAMQASDAMLRQARGMMNGPIGNSGEALGRLKDASAMIVRAMEPLQQARSQAVAQQQRQDVVPGAQPAAAGQPPATGGAAGMPATPPPPSSLGGMPPPAAQAAPPLGAPPTAPTTVPPAGSPPVLGGRPGFGGAPPPVAPGTVVQPVPNVPRVAPSGAPPSGSAPAQKPF